MTTDEIARELQKYPCVFEDVCGELHGIGALKVEEIDEETVLVFVSDERLKMDEVRIIE